MRTRTQTRWWIRLAPLGLLLVLAGGWFLWGAWSHRRLLERLEALQERGEPIDWLEMAGDGPRVAGNGALPLLETHAWAEEVEARILEEGLGPEDDPVHFVPAYVRGAPWTDAERAAVAEALDLLEPYFERLDDVLSYPGIEFPVKGPYGGPHLDVVQGAVGRLGTVGGYNPEAWPEVLDRVFALLDRWVPRNALEVTLSWVLWRVSAAAWLQAQLAETTLEGEPLLDRFGPALLRAEARVIERLRLQLRCNRVFLLRVVWAWSGGEDPFAEARETVREFRETLEELPPVDGDGTGRPLRDVFQALERTTPARPLESRWYGRPLLWHRALVQLDEEALWLAGSEDSDGLRRTLEDRIATGRGASRQALDAKQALHVLATLRLARIALAIHDHVLEHGEAPEVLAGLEERLGGAVPVDPLTGSAFVYEKGTSVAVVATDPDGSLWREMHWVNEEPLREPPRKQLEDAVLVWRMPAGPRAPERR